MLWTVREAAKLKYTPCFASAVTGASAASPFQLAMNDAIDKAGAAEPYVSPIAPPGARRTRHTYIQVPTSASHGTAAACGARPARHRSEISPRGASFLERGRARVSAAAIPDEDCRSGG